LANRNPSPRRFACLFYPSSRVGHVRPRVSTALLFELAMRFRGWTASVNRHRPYYNVACALAEASLPGEEVPTDRGARNQVESLRGAGVLVGDWPNDGWHALGNAAPHWPGDQAAERWAEITKTTRKRRGPF
jgi:hypothetical protein